LECIKFLFFKKSEKRQPEGLKIDSLVYQNFAICFLVQD